MATIEKEKALDVVRQMVTDGQVSQEVAEKYFPELKESEDEKIRKALIRFHKSTIDVDGIKGDDVLAWLEKQGENGTNGNNGEIPFSEQKQDVNIQINPSEYINDMGGNGCYLKNATQASAWKPSEEQMEYLAKAIVTLGDEGDCKTASILNYLRVELKKLREE